MVQSGLEIPCKGTVKYPATIKNHKILGLYKELVRELYCEPKAEEVLGSFLILTTGPVPEASKKPLAKSKTQTKQIDKQAKYHNIRDMFKAGWHGKKNNTDYKAVIEAD